MKWALLVLLLLQPEAEYLFIGARGMQPTDLHISVYNMVWRCLGEPEVAYPKVAWAMAEQLVDAKTGELAYGLTMYGHREDTALIVIERRYALHVTVIAHESIHAITGKSEEEFGALEAVCEMRLPGGLPPRAPLSSDSLAVLRALVTGGG